MKNERTSQGLTRLLYEENAYLYSFTAEVIECEERTFGKEERKVWAVILDRTAFFPEGGGQGADCGSLDGQEVLDVQSENGKILHYVRTAPVPGSKVVCEVNRDVRYRRMQNHSGEHLFCGLIHAKYGFENVGFHMGENLVTIDLNGVLSKEELAEMEAEANRAVYENVPIYCVYPEKPDELEYRSKLELEEEIRVVIIEGYDACACCAPHVKSTGEIGLIKLVDSMSHRGGVRITLKCGLSAYEDYVLMQEEITQIMRLFSARREECHLAAERVSEQLKSQQENITMLKKQITALHLDRLRNTLAADEGKTAELIFDATLDEVQMRTLLNKGMELIPGIVAGFMGSDTEGYRYIIVRNEAAANLPELREFAQKMNAALEGRGGGSTKMIQGSVTASRKEIEAFWKKEVLEYGA